VTTQVRKHPIPVFLDDIERHLYRNQDLEFYPDILRESRGKGFDNIGLLFDQLSSCVFGNKHGISSGIEIDSNLFGVGLRMARKKRGNK